MKFTDIISSQRPTVSFEFFPPKSDQAASDLYDAADHLRALRPSFITVTYGAGGGTRERTRKLVMRLNSETGLTTVPHLTCVGATRDELAAIVQEYVDHGIENLLALRGDPPEEHCGPYEPTPGGFRYANELVAFLKAEFPNLGIGVAGYPEGHPETRDKLLDIENLKRKVDAGADLVITQLFFDNRDFYDFVARCELEKIAVPIIAGIMPIQSLAGARKMSGMCGARLPASLLRGIDRAQGDKQAVRHVGTHWAAEQCRDLLDHNVAGIHLYTLNKSSATRRIYENLGVKHSDALSQ
ncbi:MAG: methylenetetrahydrofolate reductase [NAD(P)H] [Planctomycetes bacterium]|nr:methylenetetrahydrofolate reductase [NAD(P)H] [Planctomycetota bacterium]NOG53341.1 methylenetetrahydrofolate reductase [NAD(P)H] [Planctomycetota bacterium]